MSKVFYDRNNNSYIICDDGTIIGSGSNIGRICDDGTIYMKDKRVGMLCSDGTFIGNDNKISIVSDGCVISGGGFSGFFYDL
ncbi:hypothetical protein CVV43_04580 [Candidatus Saccharibacteria bacterium HGW-Saccharibacteria-1]|jgi:hypothetical protein|nr:MAG: hypothetical protein CVV43_04580 [Candidatus Saccharibacteria bacterium HGW-Saccharibacteria-1]